MIVPGPSPSARPRGRLGDQAEPAFAAAFFSFLKSRTFCSYAPSTTSATER